MDNDIIIDLRIHILLVLYIVLGIYSVSFGMYESYVAITLFLLFKWIFNYRKCTLSYIEYKLFRKHKEDGLLFTYLNKIVDLRQKPYIHVIYIFQTCILFLVYQNRK